MKGLNSSLPAVRQEWYPNFVGHAQFACFEFYTTFQ
jgi:hypothetical protein